MNLEEIIKEWEKNNKDIISSIENRIKDERIINAFKKIPRNLFVENDPYADRPVEIGKSQTTSQPSLMAKMLELLEINEDDVVLEIGTGSGYLTALLCELSDFVYSIDIIEHFIEKAKEKLQILGYEKFYLEVYDGCKGFPKFAPYDKIIVSAYFEKIPKVLLDQLRRGGILVLPVGNDEYQYLYKIVKTFEVTFVPMIC